MAAVHGKITAVFTIFDNSIRRVNTGKMDGTSDSLDGDREIKRSLIDRRNMITRLS